MRYIPHLFYLSSFVLLIVIISTVFSIANAAECSDVPTGEMPPSTRAIMWLHASKCDAHHADGSEEHTSCLIAVYNEKFCMPIWRIPGLEVERKKG